jgi:hypothetical protein
MVVSWAHTGNYRPPKGVGKGEGWGGPARGAGNGRGRSPMTYQTAHIYTEKSNETQRDPIKMAELRELAEREEERQKQMRDKIGTLALQAKSEETQLSAAIAYLNRSEGLPRAINVNQNTEVPFEEMVKRSLKVKPKPDDE